MGRNWPLVAPFFVLVSLLFLGCLGTPTSENKLEEVARLAPAQAKTIGYVNLKVVLGDEYLLKKGNLPNQLTYLRFIVGDGGVIVPDDEPIMIVSGTGLDTLATLLPNVIGIGRLVGVKLDINARKISGETVYAIDNNLVYWVHKGRVFIGEYPTMEKFIKARKSGQTAINRFNKIISKLKNNDIMLAMIVDEEPVKSVGISASLEGKKSHATVFIETTSSQYAELLATLLPTALPEWMKLKNVSTEGEWFRCEVEMDIEKLEKGVSIISELPSKKPSIEPVSKKPKLNTSILENHPCEDMESCLTYCDEHPKECDKIVSELGLPCKTVNECKLYCLTNPDECQSLFENFSKYMNS